MAASHQKRVRSKTKDTSTALEHTSTGLVELVRYLLAKFIHISYWECLQLIPDP